MLCPRCGSAIPADDMNLANLVAKCRRCHEAFSFADQVSATGKPAPAAAPPQRVPRPPGLWVEEDGDHRCLVRRWFAPGLLFLVFFCIAWDGFLVFWYSMALTADAPWMWIAVLFPIAHVAVGVGLTYGTVAGLFNSTVVEVHNGRLLVCHGPLPWPGNRDLDALEVRQLYCTEAQQWTRQSGTTSWPYALNAVLADGRTVPLLSDVQDKMMALFYKQQLEDWLCLKPGHVPGAVEA
jgi:hypothetical protein